MLTHLILSDHAERRMFERGISRGEVEQALRGGEAIRRYPDDTPFQSRLVLAHVEGRALHVVAADAEALDTTFVVTVYEPDPKIWSDDFKTKRSQ